MIGISVAIGTDSSEDELAAVTEAFQKDNLKVTVNASLVRASAEWQKLPMTVMIFAAQGLAPNVLWDLIKYAFNKMLTDSRLRQRKHTIVLRRKTSSYEAIVANGIYRIQSSEETVTFNSLEELIKYDKARYKKDNQE